MVLTLNCLRRSSIIPPSNSVWIKLIWFVSLFRIFSYSLWGHIFSLSFFLFLNFFLSPFFPQVMIPVLHGGHWWLLVANMRDTRFDVLSSTKLTDEMKEVTSVVVCFHIFCQTVFLLMYFFWTRVIWFRCLTFSFVFFFYLEVCIFWLVNKFCFSMIFWFSYPPFFFMCSNS